MTVQQYRRIAALGIVSQWLGTDYFRCAEIAREALMMPFGRAARQLWAMHTSGAGGLVACSKDLKGRGRPYEEAVVALVRQMNGSYNHVAAFVAGRPLSIPPTLCQARMLMGVLEGVGHRGKTQLQRAIEGGDSIRTRDLIALGADVNWIDRRDESVLLSAVYSGDVGMVRLVLDGRAQVDLGNDSSGVTPLELAASRGHHDIVKTLLEAGAKHGRALECAAWQGHAAVMTQLYELGCTQLPTLHAPARENHPAAVELLLKWKADVNARDHRGWTPLMCAASQGHVWIVRGLLAAKADVNAQTRRLETALNQAEEDSHDAVVKLLRGVGATDNHYKANKHKAKVMSVLTLVARHYGNAHP